MASLSTLGWTASAPLTLSKAFVDSDQTNFAWLVTEKMSSLSGLFTGANTCKEDGSDIRFTSDAAGNTELPTHMLYCLNRTILVERGTATATTANKLVMAGQDFLSTVRIGDIVTNTTDNTTATVTKVDSDTTLSLSADIMVSGETFNIDSIPRLRIKVKIPTLSASSDTVIYMWWGNSAATRPADTDPNGRNAVYSSSNTLAHWQLDESSGAAADATGNGWAGTRAGTIQPDRVNSQYMGYSTRFHGDNGAPAVEDRFNISTANTSPWEGGGTGPPGAFSFGGIIQVTGSTGGARVILGKRDTAAPNKGYEGRIENATNKINWVIDQGASDIQCNGNTALNVGTSEFYHIFFTYDGSGNASGLKVYLNGANDVASTVGAALTGNIDTTDTVGIASRQGGASSLPFEGFIENLRYFTTEVSAAFIKANYHNIFDSNNNTTMGAVTNYNQFPANWDLTKYIKVRTIPDYIRSDINGFIALINEKQVEFDGKEADFWATVVNGGGALRLASGLDGSGQVPLDVDICDTTLQWLDVWGLINVTEVANDIYYLFYKANVTVAQPARTSTYGRYSVHSPAGYVGRYHLSESGSGVAGEYLDVSGRMNHGQGTNAMLRVRGLNGYAQEGNGTDKKITIGDKYFPTGANPRTIWSAIFVGVDANEDSGMTYGTNSAGNRVAIQQRVDGIGVHFSNNFRGKVERQAGWHIITVRVPAGITQTYQVEIFMDGIQLYPVNLSGTPPLTLNTILGVAYIGAAPGLAYTSKLVDECGMTTVAESDDWIYLRDNMMFDTNNLWGRSQNTNNNLADLIEACCRKLLALGQSNHNLLKAIWRKLPDLLTGWKNLYSAIRDIRQILFRGDKSK